MEMLGYVLSSVLNEIMQADVLLFAPPLKSGAKYLPRTIRQVGLAPSS